MTNQLGPGAFTQTIMGGGGGVYCDDGAFFVFGIFVLTGGVYSGFFPFSLTIAPRGVGREGGVYSQSILRPLPGGGVNMLINNKGFLTPS